MIHSTITTHYVLLASSLLSRQQLLTDLRRIVLRGHTQRILRVDVAQAHHQRVLAL